MSQASILELKAITAEHVDRFQKEGRAPVKGAARRQAPVDKPKDPFHRPSPGLVKRLAAEARNDARRRHFQDEAGPSDEQRREILQAKAKRYDAMRRGDFTGMSEKEMAESAIDFERKLDEGDWSDHSSDIDESAAIARRPGSRDNSVEEDDFARIEYVDEMGRTRLGTRKEAREAAKARRSEPQRGASEPSEPDHSSYAEVLQSKVIHGDQNFFPVYEPDQAALKAKWREAEEESRSHHYDATKEVRTRGAGQYQFSLDEEKRAEQMASLKAQREETETVRLEAGRRGGQSAAQAAHKRKLDERRALVEAKRAKLLGGREVVDRLRQEKRAAEADALLREVEQSMKG